MFFKLFRNRLASVCSLVKYGCLYAEILYEPSNRLFSFIIVPMHDKYFVPKGRLRTV